MTAVARSAGVLDVEAHGPDTRLVTLAMPQGETLGFRGGQYVIVDAGVRLPGGKQAKRAYSVLSSDAEQARFRLAVKRLGGAGSGFLHAVGAGDRIPFSGPWGRFTAPEGMSGPSLVFVTDTAVTAALGLVRGRDFRGPARLAWFAEGQDGFLPPALVRSLLPGGVTLEVLPAPPVGHPDRPASARAAFDACRDRTVPEQVFLAGDGAAILPLAAGIPPDRVKVEVYFNGPPKKDAA